MESLDQLPLTKILINLRPRYVLRMLFLNKHFYQKLYQKHIFRILIDAQYPGYVYTDNPIQQYVNIYKRVKTYYQIINNQATQTNKTEENDCPLNKYMRERYYCEPKKNTLYPSELFSTKSGYPISEISIYGNPVTDMSDMIMLVQYIYREKDTETLLFKNKNELMNYIKTSHMYLRYERIIELIKEYMYNRLDHLRRINSDRLKSAEKIQCENLYKERSKIFKNSSHEDMILLPEFIKESFNVCGLPENISPLTSESWYNFVETNNSFYLDRNGDHYFYFIKTLSF